MTAIFTQYTVSKKEQMNDNQRSVLFNATFRLMTFNVINVTSLTFNVLCLIAISDDDCLDRDVQI